MPRLGSQDTCPGAPGCRKSRLSMHVSSLRRCKLRAQQGVPKTHLSLHGVMLHHPRTSAAVSPGPKIPDLTTHLPACPALVTPVHLTGASTPFRSPAGRMVRHGHSPGSARQCVHRWLVRSLPFLQMRHYNDAKKDQTPSAHSGRARDARLHFSY